MNELLDDKDKRVAQLAEAVDRVRETLAEPTRIAFEQEGGLPTAMALCLLAALTALHDGQNEEELVKVVRAAWRNYCVGSG